MNFKLKVWRQKSAAAPGRMVEYEAKDIPAEASLLEMLDIVNEELIERNEEPIAFEHDCREGICGSCGMMIDGKAHAGMHTATCQIHMREFRDGSTIALEPFRARAFPVIQDLVVDRAPFDKIIQAGGFVSVSTGAAQDANAIPIPKDIAEYAMDAAAWRSARTEPRSFSPRPRCRTSGSCRRASRSATSGCSTWSRRWSGTSVPAPTSASARGCARSPFRPTSSRA
jgi:hypothetical protein